MTASEKYALKFVEVQTLNGRLVPSVKTVADIDYNNVLTFISRFRAEDTAGFIYDLNVWIEHRLSNFERYLSDSVEDMTVAYSCSEVIIDGWYKIPVVDFKSLLEEWLNFISIQPKP